jgi:hypothetical protein
MSGAAAIGELSARFAAILVATAIVLGGAAANKGGRSDPFHDHGNKW